MLRIEGNLSISSRLSYLPRAAIFDWSRPLGSEAIRTDTLMNSSPRDVAICFGYRGG